MGELRYERVKQCPKENIGSMVGRRGTEVKIEQLPNKIESIEKVMELFWSRTKRSKV
jgi:hypothetical protein